MTYSLIRLKKITLLGILLLSSPKMLGADVICPTTDQVTFTLNVPGTCPLTVTAIGSNGQGGCYILTSCPTGTTDKYGDPVYIQVSMPDILPCKSEDSNQNYALKYTFISLPLNGTLECATPLGLKNAPKEEKNMSKRKTTPTSVARSKK